MCGIISIISKKFKNTLNKKYQSIFKQMLYANALRGWDATGVASITSSGKVEITKQATSAQIFLWNTNQPTQEHIYNNKAALIGHNRAATKGDSKKSENAHPFKEGNITLVHNGTINNHRIIKNVEVDSHAICHAINETKNLKETLSSLWGALALVWFDSNTKKFFLYQNGQRPLTLVATDTAYIISSEFELTKWILDRNDEEIEEIYEIKDHMVYSIKNEVVYEEFKVEPVIYQAPIFPSYKRTSKFKEGKLVEVTTFQTTELSYKAYNLGNYKTTALSEVGNLDVEIISEQPLEENKQYIVTIHAIYTRIDKGDLLIGKDPIELTLDDTLPNSLNNKLVSKNGTEITPKVLNFLQGKNCGCCGNGFLTQDVENGLVIPLFGNKPKQEPYGYRYICPDCVDIYTSSLERDASIYNTMS